MALQSRELLASQTKASQIGGKLTRKRLFNVYNDDGTSAVTVQQAITTVGIVVGDPHPDDPALLAIRFGDAQRRDGHRDLVELTWFYENVPVFTPDQPGQDEVGHVDENSDQRRELVKVYRVDGGPGSGADQLLFPPDGNVGGPGSVWLTRDIKGIPNDVRGHRTTALIYRVSGIITEIVEGPVNWPFLGSFASKRNSTVFFGGAIGKIAYAGPKSRTVGINKTAITHQFFYDELFHLVQVALRDQNGDIVLRGEGTSPEGQPPLQVADFVFWRQPFPQLADFHLLSDYFQP